MIIHIGYPRCASTTLQQLFAASDGRFCGCNPKAPAGAFYDPLVGDFIEGPLRLGSQRQFDERAGDARRLLADIGPKGILSYENLSFRLTPFDLPTDIKLHRLGSVAPQGSTVVVVYRPLRAFLLSLYKAYLGFGYTGSLDEFLRELQTLRAFGWLADLAVGRLVDTVHAAFDAPRVIVANLDGPEVFRRLFEALELRFPVLPATVFNESFSDSDMAPALAFNRAHPHRKTLLDWLELHRLFEELPEDSRFHLSRHRHAQHAHVATAREKAAFDRSAIQWPDGLLQLEAQNARDVTALAAAGRITLI